MMVLCVALRRIGLAVTHLAASAAEGLAPKASDNVLVPLAVWLFVSDV